MIDERRIKFMKEEIHKAISSLGYVKRITMPDSDLYLFLKDIISDCYDARKLIYEEKDLERINIEVGLVQD